MHLCIFYIWLALLSSLIIRFAQFQGSNMWACNSAVWLFLMWLLGPFGEALEEGIYPYLKTRISISVFVSIIFQYLLRCERASNPIRGMTG